MYLQILAIASFSLMVDGHLSVADCMADQADRDRCAEEYTVSSGKVSAYAFWISLPLTDFCGSKNFAKQVGCVIDADRSCRDTELKTLLASADDYVAAVETLCDNIHELDGDCMKIILRCLGFREQLLRHQQPKNSDDFLTWKTFTCSLYEVYGSCIEPKTTEVDTCNHPKTKELLKTVYKKIKPSACGASELLVTSVLFVLSIFVSSF